MAFIDPSSVCQRGRYTRAQPEELLWQHTAFTPFLSQWYPGPQPLSTPGWGTLGCTAPALCSAFTENIDISVFCFEWKEVKFQIIKIF